MYSGLPHEHRSGPIQHGFTKVFSSQPPAWAHVHSNCGCCANRTVNCTGTPDRGMAAPTITNYTKCVNPNQIVEGNAVKGFNAECDSYYYDDPTTPSGLRTYSGAVAHGAASTLGP